MSNSLDFKIFEQVREIMAVVPLYSQGEFSRTTHGIIYDETCKKLLELQKKAHCDIFQYAWAIGYEKGYTYPPDIFRDLGM